MNGRPKILITCDQISGSHTAAEWAVKTGIGYFSITSGIKRGRPVGPNKLVLWIGCIRQSETTWHENAPAVAGAGRKRDRN